MCHLLGRDALLCVSTREDKGKGIVGAAPCGRPKNSGHAD